MKLPGFTADVSLYRTNNYYLTAVLGVDNGGQVSPAIKGTHCIVHDPRCPSGFSKLRCTSFDPDSCTETGICCTPPPPPPPPQPVNCGTHLCASGQSCCGSGCCRAGTFCCNNVGCCHVGDHCRKIFGKSFCTIF
jgi:hypothetical protein